MLGRPSYCGTIKIWVQSGPLTIEGGYLATKALLTTAVTPITALVCSNDQMAVGAYQAINEQGLKIPRGYFSYWF